MLEKEALAEGPWATKQTWNVGQQISKLKQKKQEAHNYVNKEFQGTLTLVHVLLCWSQETLEHLRKH